MDEKDNILEEASENIQEAAEGAEAAIAETADAAQDTVEEAASEVEEAAESAEAAAEEAVSEVEEAVEEIRESAGEFTDAAEKAEKAAEEAEEAAEEAEEAAEEVKETAEKAVSEIKETVARKKDEVVIKKKRGLSTTNIILIIVIAVMALAIAAYVLYKEDVFKKWFPVKDKFTMEDYSTIEIDRTLVEIGDDTVQGNIDTWLDSLSTTEEVTEGTVEDGDVVCINYVGTIDGVEFDGGSAENYDLTIGSGTFIDDYEQQLIGHKLGETVKVEVTFPEDYSSEDLQGKDAVFMVDLLHKDVTTTPELTDALVAEKAADYWGEQIDTVDALRAYVKESTEKSNRQSAMVTALKDKVTVISYNEERLENFRSDALNQLSMYAQMYGMDADTLASYSGYENAEAYAKEQSEYYCTLMMMFEKLAADKGLSVTDEEVDESIQKYMDDYGYSDTYTLEQFKETNGANWLEQYKILTVLGNKVLETLEPNVVLVDSQPEAEVEETSAAE